MCYWTPESGWFQRAPACDIVVKENRSGLLTATATNNNSENKAQFKIYYYMNQSVNSYVVPK